MANDYTTWPAPALVRARLANLGVTPRAALTDDDIQGIIDELTETIKRETLRQFIPGSVGEVRYFDGSGTGIIEIDEYIAFDSVQILGFLGTGGLLMPSCIPVIRQNRPNFRIAIARGSLPTMGRIWFAEFPDGRQNIQVTAQFGYGLTIPPDLWQSVLDGAAVRAASYTIFNPAGRLTSSKLGDKSRSYALTLPGELIRAEERFLSAINRYKRPLSRHLRGANRMI